jgi:hypothetical protein
MPEKPMLLVGLAALATLAFAPGPPALHGTGQLEWNTFLGPSGSIQENAIAVDGGGNVFAVGTAASALGWGHSVAKLDSTGQLLWRHLGADTYSGVATSVAVDALGDIYVGGWGGCQAGSLAIGSAWVAKLDSGGADVWHTCLGWISDDAFAEVRTVAVDASGNVFATGRSNLSWGAPVNAHAGGDDAFVARLGPDGSLDWNTFMGGRATTWARASPWTRAETCTRRAPATRRGARRSSPTPGLGGSS